ncbi:MAG: SRPBCC family protein [Myxococcota bacterium]|jgi:ribosome-associated toxin RatA of RatAB toxin-antitoxin module|nr:SRPBCC family protein [Myxococcota bacterium]
MPNTEQDIVINTPIQTIYDIVCDYEKYPEFLPEIKRASLLQRQENIAYVEFELELIMRITYILAITETPYEGIRWELSESRHLKSNVGGWYLTKVDEQKAKANYDISVELKGLVPKSVMQRLTEKTLPLTLKRFKDRAEKLYGESSP